MNFPITVDRGKTKRKGQLWYTWPIHRGFRGKKGKNYEIALKSFKLIFRRKEKKRTNEIQEQLNAAM